MGDKYAVVQQVEDLVGMIFKGPGSFYHVVRDAG